MESLRLLRQQTLRQALQSRHTVVRQSIRQISHSSLQPFRTRPPVRISPLHRSAVKRPLSTSSISQPFRRIPRSGRRFQSTTSSSSSGAAAAEETLTLSQRMRKLSREYGWSAVGVYLALSALDFPFCFLAVRTLGTDRIGHWEHVILSYIKDVIKWPLPVGAQEQVEDMSQSVKGMVKERVPLDGINEPSGPKRILEEGESEEAYLVEEHGYREAEKANSGENASIWTQLALAYAIHKSFIFIRVPLTAAVTPKVVKTLRGWGWNIGKRPTKAVAASTGPGTSTGVNTAGTGVKSS